MSPLRSILWTLVGQPLFYCSLHNAYFYRTLLLKLFGMKCGKRVRLRRNVHIDKPWNIVADDLVIFGEGAIVQASEQITIGKRSVISQYAMLLTVSGDCATAGKTKRKGAITIRPDCWIATDAVVMPNSCIEEGVIVGARSMVDGNLPKWKICTGEPAQPRLDRVLYGTL